MADLKDPIATIRPAQSVRRPASNVHRFPTIGAHLIDEATPAYAATEPPEPAPARGSADPIGDDQAHRSAWGGLDECEGADAPPRITLLARVRSWFRNL